VLPFERLRTRPQKIRPRPAGLEGKIPPERDFHCGN
jgi:hypothetical protein